MIVWEGCGANELHCAAVSIYLIKKMPKSIMSANPDTRFESNSTPAK
jgi:hypothetical protein